MKKILTLILLVGLFSCNAEKRAARHCAKCPTKTEFIRHDSIVEKIKDTTVYVGSDSSLVWAYILCDSANQSYLKEIKILSSRGVKTQFYWKHDTLYFKTTIDSTAIYLHFKDKFKSSTENKTTVIEKKVLYIAWWVWVLAGISAIIIFILGFFLRKLFWK